MGFNIKRMQYDYILIFYTYFNIYYYYLLAII